MYDETPEAVTITAIELPEEARGAGIGSRFMLAAKNYCDTHGKQLVASNVSGARGFYEQLGFMRYMPARQFASDQYLYDPPRTAKVAARTRTQKLQEQQRFEQEFGPDRAPIEYRFPDDWTIRRLDTPHAHCYEGEMQPNCLGSAKTLRNHIKPEYWFEPDDGTPMLSLRDPENIPQASFAHPDADYVGNNFANLEIEGGHGTAYPTKTIPYIHHWWANVLGRRPMTPGQWEALEADPMELGSEEHLRQPPSSFQEYRPGGFWDRYGPMKGQLEPWAEMLRRASKPMKKAFDRITNGEDRDTVVNELRQRLVNNFKPDMIEKFIEDLDAELKRWKQYQPYTEEQMRPPGRTEFPEFYWMHGQYGPEVHNAVQQANDMYRAVSWNHPNIAMNALDQNLANLDLTSDQVDAVRRAFWDAHARAYAQRSNLQYDPANQSLQLPMSPEERYISEFQKMLREYQALGVEMTNENIERIRQQAIERSGFKSSAAQLCPTCNDPLKGEHGTFCPRCQWSEMDANLDTDPLSNPSDPTVDMHRGIQAKTAAYFHVAPSVDRERIRAHGLQPADPAQNWTTFRDDDPHPEGVYTFTDRDRANAFRIMLEFRRGQPHDIWAIDDPGEGIEDPDEFYADPDMGGSSKYLTKPVYPRLVEGPEHREDMPEYMQPQYLRPDDPWKRGPYPLAEDEGRGRPYPPTDSRAWAERVGAHKTADKLHDFLMNPKSRPDLQTPEAQAFLQHLKTFYHNDKTDPLMPWLTREWKKGRIQHGRPEYPGVVEIRRGPGNEPTPVPPGPELTIPELRVGPRIFNHLDLEPSNLDHWADFLQSNHPIRRGLGDIMKHDVSSLATQIRQWEEAMAATAHEEALKGGQVVHTTPDDWTIRKLGPDELEAEGNAMGHCVGGHGYANAVQNGETLIYSLRDPKNAPHATIEIEPEETLGGDYDPDWLEKWIAGHPHHPERTNAATEALRNVPVAIQGLREYHAIPEVQGYGTPPPHEYADLYEKLWNWHGHTPTIALPDRGWVKQIQGKGNKAPISEHQARLKHWFQSFPEDRRPRPEYDGDITDVAELNPDHPDAGLEVGNMIGDYGLPEPDTDYDRLVNSIERRPRWGDSSYDHGDIDAVYQHALRRGEIPQLAEALEGYREKAWDDLNVIRENNWEHLPSYPGEEWDEEPERWQDPDPEYEQYYGTDDRTPEERFQDAQRIYRDSEDDLHREHVPSQIENALAEKLKDHYHPYPFTDAQGQRQEPGFYNALFRPPAGVSPTGTFSSTKWFEAVEDAP